MFSILKKKCNAKHECDCSEISILNADSYDVSARNWINRFYKKYQGKLTLPECAKALKTYYSESCDNQKNNPSVINLYNQALSGYIDSYQKIDTFNVDIVKLIKSKLPFIESKIADLNESYNHNPTEESFYLRLTAIDLLIESVFDEVDIGKYQSTKGFLTPNFCYDIKTAVLFCLRIFITKEFHESDNPKILSLYLKQFNRKNVEQILAFSLGITSLDLLFSNIKISDPLF